MWTRFAQRKRLQSAMEYLMTYGWAILIIAVVLGALFQLGVFNATNFAPRVPAGACQVERFATQVALAGECQGGLPQYVAGFTGQVPAYMVPIPNPTFNFTISVWFNTNVATGTGCCNGPLLDIYNASTNSGIGGSQNYDYAALFATGQGVSYAEYWPQNWQFAYGSAVSTGAWHNAIIAVAGYNSVTVYVDGATTGPTTFSIPLSTVSQFFTSPALALGSNPPGGLEISPSGVLMANLQLYNTTLSADEANALYLEGIGGAPVEVHNIIGWWQLNGNMNDYSQNGDGGRVVNASYTGAYLGGYTAP